jgi:hypothetical protein
MFCRTVYSPNEAIISIIGEALRFRNGLYNAISDNMPTAVAKIMAKGMDKHTGQWSWIEKRYVK